MRISDWSSDVCSSDLRHLADSEYIAGDAYSIADIAIWPWYGRVVTGDAYGASEFLSADSYTHLIRWARQIDERPAVQRGVMVNRLNGPLGGQLHERHRAADLEPRTDRERPGRKRNQ